MTSCKLIIKNVRKNIRDYLIYFLTLMISVSVFYAFNSISDQPAFSEMGMTKTLLYDQLGILLSTLTVLIAVVLAFLIIYANQFLLKRRKKELGLYMVLGMKKGRISRIFAGETFCVGVIALVTGLCLGVALSQGISLVALKLFAIELSKFRLVFSMGAFQKTVLCFAVIFLLVMTFNVWSVSSVQLIDLLTAGRKNETSQNQSRLLPVLLFLVSLACILSSGVMFYRNGILPSRENRSFQAAGILIVAGTFLFFYSLSTVLVQVLRANSNVYLRGLNTFLVRQVGSKIRTNYFIMTIVCGLLTVTICAVSVGVSTALAMNELSGSATPYDLNVLSNVSMDGDSSILEYLASKDADLSGYAENMEQISIYEADFTYGSLFEGQNVELWPIDEGISDSSVSVLAVSDFNRALKMQGKEPVALTENQYLLNCNYKGTFQYVEEALESHADLVLAGIPLQRASDTVLEETYFMTSVGNNDRGTLIVPDAVVHSLTKDVNVLLVLYRPDADSDAVLQKMIPIGLDDTHGYRYAEKNMMYEMFYGFKSWGQRRNRSTEPCCLRQQSSLRLRLQWQVFFLPF
ncbi:ABC transporter permease [Lachnospiraceae bacterium 56-18]